MGPKKDAFADIFQSVASSRNNKSNLLDLQRSKVPVTQTPVTQTLGHLVDQKPIPGPNWDEFEIFSSNSSSSSKITTPIPTNDPFAIFDTPQPPARPSSKPQSQELNLLDDDFTDVFQPTSQPTPQPPPPSVNPIPNSRDQRDEIIAQLLDIGFDVVSCNKAVDAVGLDLQRCVNLIMNQNQPPQTKSQANTKSPSPDLGTAINDLSSDLLHKATFLFNKSKETVLKNIEQFQQKDGTAMPPWMRNQQQYKAQASEKANGHVYEDYGEDEDNIDKDAIRRFMESQRHRERSPKLTPQQRPAPKQTPKHTPKHTPHTSRSQTPNPTKTPQNEEVDLLGLTETLSIPSHGRKTTNEPLNEFIKSDYDTRKEKATKSFANGDFDDACINYTKCLEVLTPTHELRIVINSNLAITYIKLGDYKQARDHCDQGLALISKHELNDRQYLINNKPIKLWYTKLLARKAETLEMVESFKSSLQCYTELIELGVNDKKTMDARRRIANIVNPPPPRPKPVVKAETVVKNNDNLKRVQQQNRIQQQREQEKYLLHDKVHQKVGEWSNGNEDNLRALLTKLPDILPVRLGFAFLTTKKISLNDIMLPKKVKINYMKVISAIHPDKLTSLDLSVEEEMLCQAVFIILNKSWESFKQTENV